MCANWCRCNPRRSLVAVVTLLSLGVQLVQVNCDPPLDSANMPGTSEKVNTLQDVENILASPLLKFSGDMLRLSGGGGQSNVIFSPMSIQAALNLVLVGAEPKSKTEQELVAGLGYNLSDQPLEMVHRAYAKLIQTFHEINEIGKKEKQTRATESEGQFGPELKSPILDIWSMGITKNAELLPSYESYLQKYYNGSVAPISDKDSEGRKKVLDRVNNWGKEAGFSSDLLTDKELKEYFRILLLSAVRVEAFWIENFYENRFEVLFYNNGSPDQAVKNSTGLIGRDLKGHLVEFVSIDQTKLKSNHNRISGEHAADMAELSKHNFRAINIPLVGNISYTIIEPFDQVKGNTLSKLSSALLASSGGKQNLLHKVLRVLDSNEARVEFEQVKMPKFNFESSIDLVGPLQSMGIVEVFSNTRAELSKMSKNEKLYVEKAKHDAFIEVNKKGLKAAGVTKIVVVPLMAVIRREPLRVAIQNPFMFIVRFGKLPMFVGQLTQIKT